MSSETYEIILDCPPGPYRPDDALKDILINLPLSIDDFTILGKCFGSWTFELKKEKNIIYEQNKTEIVKRIEETYNSGKIRYAEW